MTKIQLAIDTLEVDDALTLIQRLHPYIDIIEAGTPFIKRFGLDVLRSFRQVAPDKGIVADMKAMDAGAYEASIAFTAGADMMTVLGCSDDETILGAVREANKRNRQVAVDLIAVPDILARAQRLQQLGVHYLGVHTGLDLQARGVTPLADLQRLVGTIHIPLIVAGGINAENIQAFVPYKPAIVVVGSALTQASDPTSIAIALREKLSWSFPQTSEV